MNLCTYLVLYFLILMTLLETGVVFVWEKEYAKETTSGHSRRVAKYSQMIGYHMKKTPEEQEEIYYAALLHDVGKIRVPREVINKVGKLTEEEFELIKIHPITGYHILKEISEASAIEDGAKFYHERYDGTGYPNGLKGENIPEIARIIGVADAYDAMASNRSYRKVLPQEIVREEIVKGRGSQFDPVIADIMLQMIDEDKEYTMKEAENVIKTILAVDDEPLNLQTIKSLLKGNEIYHVICADNGEAALKILQSEKIDLVLLDIEMPQMNGFEVLQRIRETSDVAVVFTTSEKDIKTIQKSVAAGIDDYLTKPFLPAVLKEIIHNVLR